MTPANRPATSELWPTWAETVFSASGWKSSGSEPYLSVSARLVACAWVNPVLPPPVIWTLPAVMGSAVSLGRGHVAVEDDRGRVERLVIGVAAVGARVVRVVLAGGERRERSRRPRR